MLTLRKRDNDGYDLRDMNKYNASGVVIDFFLRKSKLDKLL